MAALLAQAMGGSRRMMPQELLHCWGLEQNFPRHIWAPHVSGRLGVGYRLSA